MNEPNNGPKREQHLSRRDIHRLGPDTNWYENRKLRTIAKVGKTATLRIEPDYDGRVDMLGSTQPLARFVHREDKYMVIAVPWVMENGTVRTVLQHYRVVKMLGIYHYMVEFLFEYIFEESLPV